MWNCASLGKKLRLKTNEMRIKQMLIGYIRSGLISNRNPASIGDKIIAEELTVSVME
jgi:hypothetical protein